MQNRLFIFILLFSFIACNKNVEWSKYKSVANNQWNKDSIITFHFTQTDTLKRYNLFLNIRNNGAYEFSNIYLLTSVKFPNKNMVIDTLEYEMADPEGNWLGTGFTDLKENKLVFKKNIVFPEKGNYTVTIQHAVRKDGAVKGENNLKGITDVGFSIEKVK